MWASWAAGTVASVMGSLMALAMREQFVAGAPLVEANRGDLRFGAPLTAITAAVVGVIGSLAAFLSGPVLWPLGAFSPTAALVVALGLLPQLKWRWSVLQVIGAAAAARSGWAGLAQLVS